MADFDPGMPRKVLEWARSHGVLHNDCLMAGDPCEGCKQIVVDAFDHFYGHCSDVGEVIAAILEDYRKEEGGE